jgi:hypothetical protein
MPNLKYDEIKARVEGTQEWARHWNAKVLLHDLKTQPEKYQNPDTAAAEEQLRAAALDLDKKTKDITALASTGT